MSGKMRALVPLIATAMAADTGWKRPTRTKQRMGKTMPRKWWLRRKTRLRMAKESRRRNR